MADPRPPLGHQIHLTLVRHGPDAARAHARDAGQPDLFERVSAVADEEPTPSFLHSALCAMSLPVRRPVDEHAPIIRRDGQYTLVINPKPVVDLRGGQQILRSLGIHSMRLLTNNPRKFVGLQGYGLSVSETLPLEIPASATTRKYLKVKKEKLGHRLKSV